MRLSRYVRIYQSPVDPGYYLLYSTKRTSVAFVRDFVLSALDAGSLSDSHQETLLRLGILVADPDLEVQEMAAFFDRINSARSVFTAIVVLNLDCNLACTYCYEEGIKTRQYMERGVIDLFIERVKALDFRKIKEVAIDFYGGEPLLSVETILYVSERLKETGDELGFGYSFRLVTNGTLLTAKTVEKLLALGLKGAKVTLDGPEKLHNSTRPFVGGKGSFGRIVSNMSDACEMIDIQIGGNYTNATYKSFPLLLDDLAQKGITPDKIALVKFDPVAATDRRQGGSPELGAGCASINEEWLFEAGVFLREEILKRGYRTPKITPLTCVVELENDIVLNIDGSIYKCPGMLGHKEFSVGTIQEGMIDYRHIYGLDHWKNAECLDCAYLPLCFGGCRFMSMLKTGSISGIDCRKSLFDATLEAFLYQEIKYKDQLVGQKSRPSSRPVVDRE
jgi:uncharacterized protein